MLAAPLLSLLLFWPPLPGECYTPAGHKKVPSAIGALNLPADAYVAEIDMSASVKYLLSPVEEALFKQLNVYQVTLNDGESYRSAVLMAFFMDDAVFNGRSGSKPPEQRGKRYLEYSQLQKILYTQKQILDEIAFLRVLADDRLYAPPDKNGERKPFKIFGRDFGLFARNKPQVFSYEWPEIAAAMINGEFGFKSDLRISGSLFGFMASIYAAGIAFNHEDKGVNFLFFVAPGSERDFWAPIFEKTVVAQ
jgi:hypothetical protein